MQDMRNTAISNEYRSVPISVLVDSANNPRKRFDEKNLEELAAYVPRHISGLLYSLVILWPRTPSGAWEWWFAFPKGT